MTDRIVYQNNELYYYKEGAGKKVILLFHGFGQDHWAFESWTEALKDDYTIYSFDIFFHGQSRWESSHPINKQDWKKILTKFLDSEQIQNFEMAAFSIGARFMFTTLGLMPERVTRLIAIAPDGIRVNFWYRLATSAGLTRSFFRSMILKPNRLLFLLRILKFFRIENQKLLRFVELQVNSKEKRQRVYSTWVYFRRLLCSRTALRELFNTNNITAIFIAGNADKVIRPEPIKSFANSLRNCQFHLLDVSHSELINESLKYIK